MKGKLLAILLACLLLLAGCGREEPPTEPEEVWEPERITGLDRLLERVNTQHEAVRKPVVDIQKYIQEFSENPIDIAPYMISREFDAGARLTVEQAQRDLELFLRIMEGNYGMYYFWGEALFQEAEAGILEQLASCEEGITAGQWAELLKEGFSFLQDAHFRINDEALHATVVGYVYNSVPFEKCETEYRSADTLQVVERIGGEEHLDEVFRLSIDGEGRLVYFPVVLAGEEPQPLLVQYRDGQSQYLPVPEREACYRGGDTQVSLHYNRGYPVLFARNMGFDATEKDPMEGRAFLRYAELLKEEPVVIVDLRSNTGGNLILPMKWLAEYAGRPVPTNYVTIDYMTEEALWEYGTNEDNFSYVPYDEMKEFGGWEAVSENYMTSNSQPDCFVENKRLLVLLIGKNTGSAAEEMVDMAFNLENTLLVGENTYGAMVSNAYAWVFLPNSGIKIQFGSTLSIFPEGHFSEFVGIQPDLWAAGDAEEQVVRMLERMKENARAY